MADSGSNSFIGGLLQLIGGILMLVLYLGIAVFSIAALAAWIGASLVILTGSTPGIFQPFGGLLVGLFVGLIRFMMVVLGLVSVWLLLTGRIDEFIDGALDDSTESTSTSSTTQDDRSRSQSSPSTSTETKVYSSSGSESDNEFDEYGQIKE